MGKKLLIDATHAEETRVVVLDGNKVEEFDFETIHKRQLAGNIYLAKVTRVEPSLQAAFVDYGGNRHGFLAFAEIPPDYYQIPVADRLALLEEERALVRDQEEETTRRTRRRRNDKSEKGGKSARDAHGDENSDDETFEGETPEADAALTAAQDSAAVMEAPAEDVTPEVAEETGPVAEALQPVAEDAPASDEAEDAAPAEAETSSDAASDTPADEDKPAPRAPMAANADGMEHRTYGAMDIVELDEDDSASADDADDAQGDDHGHDHADGDDKDDKKPYRAADHAADNDSDIESVADEDVSDEVRPPRRSRARRYKIQEVIKVRQIMLVQVVKEERGNKGAALTTYLSLAGRYCVLMPNTARGGGISRKITNAADRKKLKDIASEFDVPEGAGLIIRTAGANRTKSEIKRDYEYLFRVWEQIRELTLKSIAPAPIYEEGNLIKRSIRDLYNKDIDEVLVEGEAGYRTAKDFMKMIMPSHAKNVKLYGEGLPLFARYQVESYLGQMFNPTVQLKSGGYIVIGVTEALVAIDVNSGKSTREGSIEDTALKTNLEAADEVARQLRLRDLAGLIVIDFIDMEERKNNAAVEKRLKDALRTDRARIQVGRISAFGLLEMSRQRLRPGMIEATTQPCQHCHGTGLIRSDNSLALQILRSLEEEGTRNRSKEVLVKAPIGIVNYLFNTKREHLQQIELRYGMAIRIEADPSLISPDYSIEKFKTATRIVTAPATPVVSLDAKTMSDLDDYEDEDETETEDTLKAKADESGETEAKADGNEDGNGEGGKRKRRRRRRRRGGQSNGNRNEGDTDGDDSSDDDTGSEDAPAAEPAAERVAQAPAEAVEETADETAKADAAPVEEPKPARRRRSRRKSTDAEGDVAKEDAKQEAPAEPVSEAPAEAEAEAEKPKRRRAPRRKKAEIEAEKAAKAEEAARAAEPVAAGGTELPDETPSEAPVENPIEAPVPSTPEDAPATPVEAPDDQPAEIPVEAPVETPDESIAEVPGAEAEAQPAEVQPVVTTGEEAQAEPAPEAEPAAETKPTKPRRAGWWARKS